jgi:4'-phosphopantetheinyl transferase
VIRLLWLEQNETDVPAGDDWLSPGEALTMSRLRFAGRRADWRLGRWTAKRAIACNLNYPHAFKDIEIRPDSMGAPEALIRNERAEVAFSLSHRGGTAACAVTSPGAAIGCDLEMVEERSDAFVTDYFTGDEQALVARAPADVRAQAANLIWSAKESALKALRQGLRWDTRSVIVWPEDALTLPAPDAWRRLCVRCANGATFEGWWTRSGPFVRTVVSAPPPGPPVVFPAG